MNPVKAARDVAGDGFTISYEWKEMLIYWEGGNGVVFDCGWGVEPSVVYVPAEEAWDGLVPNWLVGRRAAVVDRLRRYSAHIVEDDPGWKQASWRLRTRIQ